ncbi:MAG: hypothetical protein AB7V13_07015 [Pseudorhodoplanes sp.]|uniref:hypothetical protein n=1 Tax=Pseudorhodoplanes sp. TaxID=1934341 RepID=UPI003D0C54D8
MLLGDVIARFDDDSTALQMLMSLDDLALIARVRQACERDDYQLGEFAALAVQRYAASASDEEWVTVLGQMGRTQAPGIELLRRALIWMLDLEHAHG